MAIEKGSSTPKSKDLPMKRFNQDPHFNIARNTLLELGSGNIIYASGRDEVYGCPFGRDAATTVMFILDSFFSHQDLELLAIAKKSLLTLAQLQGREFNLESGEQPGKIIHECRWENHSHLTSKKSFYKGNWDKPWYIYPDGIMRNYDSIDSTPLFLIAAYKYWQITQDGEFVVSVLNNIEAGLNWIITYGDSDKDSLLEYDFPDERKYGGLLVQSWTDSHESLRQANGQMPLYPIAPVEVQSYAWLALKVWSDYYRQDSNKTDFARKLSLQADLIKQRFNELFLIKDSGLTFAAQALDGNKNQIKTITSNPLIALWSAYEITEAGQYKIETIFNSQYLPEVIERGLQDDLFERRLGIRTMSTKSPTFNPGKDSYHNGSVWPFQNGMIYRGLVRLGYFDQARQIRESIYTAIEHFGTPMELINIDENGNYVNYLSPSGQEGCRNQA